jgi:hypothetical protein
MSDEVRNSSILCLKINPLLEQALAGFGSEVRVLAVYVHDRRVAGRGWLPAGVGGAAVDMDLIATKPRSR